MTAPSFFSIDAKPGRVSLWALSWLLFISGLLLYFCVSAQRHHANPDDKVMPSFAQLSKASFDAVMKPAEEDDEGVAAAGGFVTRLRSSMLWKDTSATSRRFLISLALLFPAVLLGLHMGLFPYVAAFFHRFILFFDKIVTLSLLPILFIAFGIDELSKIMLIIIGVAPTIILDTVNLSRSVPREQLVKAFTLGSGSFGVTYLVVLKQILPRVINSIRLNLKPLMLFLFAGEMIASTDGLAYRIALARRHLAMDLIVPYVLWVALLLFVTDWLLRALNRRLHPWFQEG